MKGFTTVRPIRAWLLGGVAIAGMAAPAANAAFVVTSSGSTLAPSDSYVATPGSTANSPSYTTQTGNDYFLAVPGQYNFNHFFSTPQSAILGTDTAVGNYAFQDSYVFQVAAGANGDTAVATLNLPSTFSMSDLQFRLYQVTSGTTSPILGPLAGNPAYVSTLSSWMGTPGIGGSQVITADFTGLNASDTYVLDIAGIATGTGGGQYFGALDLQPVPLPAGVWLLLTGLCGILLATRGRSGDTPLV